MRLPAAPILLVLLPLAVFLAIFHPATLSVGNAGWLIRGTDNGENALGLHAWLHDPATGGRPQTRLLNAPEGVALLFTDSNPLVALAARPFARSLPDDAQFVGPWILFCLILQAAFAWLLLSRHAPGPLALWCGVALLAFPPTLANRFVHANLMAHWTILAALWLFLDPTRRSRLRWWLPLIGVTALIHSYLLVMVGAIWASAMLRQAARGDRRARALAAAHGAAILPAVAGLAWWLGVAGDYAVAGNYGAFAMPLDALWNPANPSYSNLLPATAQRPGRGFEGFQYLGAGGLLLIAVAASALWRLPRSPEERVIHRRLRWLLPALAVLTVLAISHHVDVAGFKFLRLPLPEHAITALDAVRASGRLFWPVGYVLVFAALLAAFRIERSRAGLVLLGLVVIQLVDLSGMAQAIRATSAEAGAHRLYARTPDPRWDALIARARDVAFIPGDATADLALFQEVAWRAASAGKPVTTVYAARSSRATARRLAADQAAFARGATVPDRLYILLPTTLVPPPANARLIQLDGVRVIASSSSPAVP